MAKKTKKVNSVTVNMEGVSSSVLVPEGDYVAKADSIESAESESGKPYLKWVFKVTEGEYKGNKLYHNTSLQPQALFNLKGVLISLGIPVPESTFNIDFDDIVGRSCGLTVAHETYEGKKKARITEFYPLDNLEAEEGDDIDLESLDISELLELADENDIEIPAKARKNKAKIIKLIEAAQEDDEDSDDESEDQEEPDEDTEETEELDLEELDLKELKALAKEHGISIPKGKSKGGDDVLRGTLIHALLEHLNNEDESDEAEDDIEDDQEDEVDLSVMSIKELKAFAAEHDIEIPKKIAKSKEKIIALIEAEMGEPEDSEEAEEVNLEEMDLDELVDFAANNDIPLSKKAMKSEKVARKVIAAALEDEDE